MDPYNNPYSSNHTPYTVPTPQWVSPPIPQLIERRNSGNGFGMMVSPPPFGMGAVMMTMSPSPPPRALQLQQHNNHQYNQYQSGYRQNNGFAALEQRRMTPTPSPPVMGIGRMGGITQMRRSSLSPAPYHMPVRQNSNGNGGGGGWDLGRGMGISISPTPSSISMGMRTRVEEMNYMRLWSHSPTLPERNNDGIRMTETPIPQFSDDSLAAEWNPSPSPQLNTGARFGMSPSPSPSFGMRMNIGSSSESVFQPQYLDMHERITPSASVGMQLPFPGAYSTEAFEDLGEAESRVPYSGRNINERIADFVRDQYRDGEENWSGIGGHGGSEEGRSRRTTTNGRLRRADTGTPKNKKGNKIKDKARDRVLLTVTPSPSPPRPQPQPSTENIFLAMARQANEDLEGLDLHEQVEGLWKLVSLSDEKMRFAFQLGKELLDILKPEFEDFALYTYGPIFLGTMTTLDVIHVMVDPFGKLASDKPVIFHDRHSQKRLSDAIYESLRKQQYKLSFCKDVMKSEVDISLAGHKIPQISFTYRSSGLKCVVTVENFMTVQDSRLIQFVTSLDPRVHPMLCLLGVFSSTHELLETKDELFRNHVVIWMLITFLSKSKIIPNMHELHALSEAPLDLDNVDISFCSDTNKVPAGANRVPAELMGDPSIKTLSVLALLKDFFKFCGDADLKHFVVSPAVGDLIPVKAFGRNLGPSFPESIKSRYLKGFNQAARSEKFYCGAPLGVQHPLDLVTNITKSIEFSEVTRFQKVCRAAYRELTSILDNGYGNVIAIFADVDMLMKEEVCKPLTPAVVEEDESSDDEIEEATEVASALPPPVEESSWEMDTDEENNPVEEEELFYSQPKGKIRMNQALRSFFEKAISHVDGAEDIEFMDVRKKFQSLWVQYIYEFNSKFWAVCLDFDMDIVFDTEEFAWTDEAKKELGLLERFNSIKSDVESMKFECQCSTKGTICDLLYKKKVWKKKFFAASIRPIWIALSRSSVLATQLHKDGNADLSFIKKKIRIPRSKQLVFNCKLELNLDFREEDDIPDNEDKICAVATINLEDTSYSQRGKSLRIKKLRFLCSLYEKLCMKYLNLRIRQWIECNKDLDFKNLNNSYKKEQKRRLGHPRWRKFKVKWLRKQKELEEEMREMQKLEKERRQYIQRMMKAQENSSQSLSENATAEDEIKSKHIRFESEDEEEDESQSMKDESETHHLSQNDNKASESEEHLDLDENEMVIEIEEVVVKVDIQERNQDIPDEEQEQTEAPPLLNENHVNGEEQSPFINGEGKESLTQMDLDNLLQPQGQKQMEIEQQITSGVAANDNEESMVVSAKEQTEDEVGDKVPVVPPKPEVSLDDVTKVEDQSLSLGLFDDEDCSTEEKENCIGEEQSDNVVQVNSEVPIPIMKGIEVLDEGESHKTVQIQE